MKKIIAVVFISITLILSLFYFDLPFNLLRPVFHADDIDRYSKVNRIDPLFVIALIKVESNFLKKARSNKGAMGLMQILPATAREMSTELGYKTFNEASLHDSRFNIEIGTRYIAKLIKEFDGNNILALAAYNAGKSKVSDWYRQNPLIGIEIEDIPYPETRNYVREVIKTYRWLKMLKEFKNLIRGKIA